MSNDEKKSIDFSSWKMFIEEPALAIVVIAGVFLIFFTWKWETEAADRQEMKQMEVK